MHLLPVTVMLFPSMVRFRVVSCECFMPVCFAEELVGVGHLRPTG